MLLFRYVLGVGICSQDMAFAAQNSPAGLAEVEIISNTFIEKYIYVVIQTPFNKI